MYSLILYCILSTFIAQWTLSHLLEVRPKERPPLPAWLTFCLITVGYAIVFYQTGRLTFGSFLISIILASLILLALIDYATFELPNELVLTVGICGFLYHVLFISHSFSELILGFFAASLPLLLLSLLSKGNMGGGDIKLAAACGVWLGPVLVLLGLFLSTLMGTAWYGALLILKKKELKSMIAFGPFLALGFILSFFYGQSLLNWYIQLII